MLSPGPVRAQGRQTSRSAFRMTDAQDLAFSASRQPPKRTALIEVRSKASSCAFGAEPQEPLLYAALRAGVAVPYECATGTCGTCKARRLAGVIVGGWRGAPGNAYLRPALDRGPRCPTPAPTAMRFGVPGRVNLASPHPVRADVCLGSAH